MKLSKDDLSFALDCAKQYFYDSLNSDYPGKDDLKNAELFRDLEQEADKDALEIEGYERSKWTRFNPNVPKTFPPENETVDTYCSGHYLSTSFCYRFISKWWTESTIYWRPLPPPPGKEGK